MYYWTFQKKEVFEKIKKEGLFFPDFAYRGDQSYLKNSYDLALEIFKRYNPSFSDAKGVIFSFDRDIMDSFENVEEIKAFFEKGSMARFIQKSGEQSHSTDYVLLQLSGYEGVKTVPVDIPFFTGFCDLDIAIENGAVKLNPLQVEDRFGKSEEYIHEMLIRWLKGNYSGPLFQAPFVKNILQHHLPYIKAENIVNAYPAEQYINF